MEENKKLDCGIAGQNDENKKADNKLVTRCTNVITVTFSTCVSLLMIGICVWLMRLMLG